MKKTLIAIMLTVAAGASAQTISHQVLNSGGGDKVAAGFWLTDNIGEPFTETFGPVGSLMLTQGFLQPEYDGVVIEKEGIIVYNGVTPNNDGRNDKWYIGNIEEFPDNNVVLFNRWGVKVFETKGYNNESNYWPTGDMLGKLLSTTYFYIIDLGNGSKPVKGWVELIKN
jgi:gliding motility-associated-like protein